MFTEEGSQVKVPKTEQPRRTLAEGSHEGDGNTPPDSQPLCVWGRHGVDASYRRIDTWHQRFGL